jgi:hypothetical protein
MPITIPKSTGSELELKDEPRLQFRHQSVWEAASQRHMFGPCDKILAVFGTDRLGVE